jgi:hypothetical protein
MINDTGHGGREKEGNGGKERRGKEGKEEDVRTERDIS